MDIRIVDNRTYKTEKCDAVVEQDRGSLQSGCHIIKGFESQEISDILDYAKNINIAVVVYLYDLDSKPLK